jgi:diguanylate cyclase (GGDEF)-like protein
MTSPAAGPTPPESRLPRDPSLGSFGRFIGRSLHASTVGKLNNAEIVAWQSSRRLMMACGVAIVGLALRLTGLVEGPVWPILVIIPAYIGIISVLTLKIEQRREVTRPALILLSLTDVGCVFGIVGLISNPAYYPRALLLSLLALQFTQLFFGRTPALTMIIASTAGYIGMMFMASRDGFAIGWVEQLWLLGIYVVVALNGMALQANANQRLAELVDLFASAQRGDLSRPFIDDGHREPDGITLLGRSYNHLRSELATMVLTDPLTSCLNRRGFDQVLQHALSAAGRRGGEIALLAIDIDHFKSINDTAGHLAGDAVLRELSDVLSQTSRGGDVVARVGGEEFVVLLPDSDAEVATAVGERLAGAIREHDFRMVRGSRQVTISVGIAAVQVTDEHISESLRARADEALYVAKRLGRDRVVLWAPGLRSNATPAWTSVVA